MLLLASENICSFLRVKSARVITFEQFNQALTELAPKRFKGKSKEESLPQLYALIVGKEPANIGVTVSVSSILTATYSKYTDTQHTYVHYCLPVSVWNYSISRNFKSFKLTTNN